MPKAFCVMPFNHLHLDPDGGVRVCCVANESIQDKGGPVSLYTHGVEDIWRSSYMRDVRRAMLQGVPLKTCETCYQYESVGAVSFRQIFNESSNYSSFPAEVFAAAETSSPDTGLEQQARDRYGLDADLVDGPPRFYQILLGNHCNLKCRMCGSDLSSSIEADPVHSRWTPIWSASLPFWKKDAVSIGPKPQIGIRHDGFGGLEYHEGLPRCWTSGDAAISLPWSKSQSLASMEIELWPELVCDASVLIEINGIEFPLIDLRSQATVIETDLSALPMGDELTIRVQSKKWVPNDNTGTLKLSLVGLPVRDIRLHRPKTRGPNRRALGGRFAGDGPWYQQASLLYGELLKDPTRLKKVKITGGEPLLSPHTGEVLDYLIDRGAASGLVLDLTTNCTKVDDELLAKLARFHRVEIGVSIDGTQLDQEYIRFPVKWHDVSENIRSFMTLQNAYFQIQPTVQLYNMLTISELLKWCDDLDISFYPQLLFYPHHLSIDLAPRESFRRAASRLLAAIPSVKRADNREHASRLAQALADKAVADAPGAADSKARARLLRDFMRFTNDLDRSRGQSFRDTYPEMLQLLADDGFAWQDETRYLTDNR